jgi:hypothetical protein
MDKIEYINNLDIVIKEDINAIYECASLKNYAEMIYFTNRIMSNAYLISKSNSEVEGYLFLGSLLRVLAEESSIALNIIRQKKNQKRKLNKSYLNI